MVLPPPAVAPDWVAAFPAISRLPIYFIAPLSPDPHPSRWHCPSASVSSTRSLHSPPPRPPSRHRRCSHRPPLNASVTTLASPSQAISFSQSASVGAILLPPGSILPRATLRWCEAGDLGPPATTTVLARSAAAGAGAARGRGSPPAHRCPLIHSDCNCWRVCRTSAQGRCQLAPCRHLHAILYHCGLGAAVVCLSDAGCCQRSAAADAG